MGIASLVDGHILAQLRAYVNPQDEKIFVNLSQKNA